MPEVTAQEIQATQGTRLSDVPPWMSYAAEFEEKIDPTLEAEVEQYAQTRHEKSSTQAKEELCRQRELNSDVAKQYQFLTPEEYEEIAPRIGRVMHSSQLITDLRDKCHVKCWYRQHPQPDKLTLVYSDPSGSEVPQVACWVQAGYMPEYSLMRFDEHGVPLDERRRGWRTCLLQMLLKGIVTEELVIKVFGAATGPASTRFNSMLYEWRNRRISAV